MSERFGVPEDDLEQYMWNSEDTGGEESIAMLTLKALTVLYMASAVSSLYFLSVYYGDIDVYADRLRALRLELDWYPSINFALNVNFDFVFAWPTDLRVEFQLPMFFSFSLVAFERLIALLWLLNDYMKRFEVNESSFRYAVRMVYAPYWLGEAFFVSFEVGWECLVFLYALVPGISYFLLLVGAMACVLMALRR